MLKESLAWLNVRPGGVYADVTFGGGGHSRAILDSLGQGRLIAFDRDGEAIANAPGDERLTMVRANYRHLARYLRFHGIEKLDGILADLGVSSHQFDEPSRGFSTRHDGPLDLRMDGSAGISAAEYLASCSEKELAAILREYADLREAGKVARAIVEARETGPIGTTALLRHVIARFAPRNEENKFLARVFQALRIEVNEEMDALRELLAQAAEALSPGGRFVVISYHSLEDRMVKNFFRSGKESGEVEKDFYGNRICPWKVLTSKPLSPSEAEIERNNRSRSARLRAAERI